MRQMYLLDKEDIYIIHRKVIDDFGGDTSYYSNTDEKIESILSQQYGFFGHDKYSTVYDKAAILMYFLIKGHCFCDGNKRVGFVSTVVLLTLNGLDDNIDGLERYYKAMEIAELQLRGEKVDEYISYLSDWLKQRFKRAKV